MRMVPSLRARLTVIILIPLMVVALAVGYWQLANARQTANDVFDRSVLAAALAVANDVAISGGDALSARTRDILSDTSGGLVYYHVYAPDGVIVAGYATPPVGIPRIEDAAAGPAYFNARYLGRDVQGVRLQSTTQIDGFAGIFTTTVWQDASVRAAFVRDLVLRSSLAILGLIASVALIVWFGVRLGLRPLLELESAIASRSGSDLAPIRRAVPNEVGGIVATLNRLFGQVTSSMAAQSEFISNAAHQLRNPIAGVLALAEAVQGAKTWDDARKRSDDLLGAARETAALSQQLLLMERAKAISPSSAMERFNLADACSDWVDVLLAEAPSGVSITLELRSDVEEVTADRTMLEQALRNLVDNAFRHAGPELSAVRVILDRSGDHVMLCVEDDGVGLSEDALRAAKERFRSVSSTSRSGLGVSIAEAVAQGHGGDLVLERLAPGLRVALRLCI